MAELLRTIVDARSTIQADSPTDPCLSEANLNQFKTALVNLAVNARDAVDGEGQLRKRWAPRLRVALTTGYSDALAADRDGIRAAPQTLFD